MTEQTVEDVLEGVDVESFLKELKALGSWIKEQRGPEDLEHLKKVERWGRTCSGLGYATAWMGPNLLSASLIALGRSIRWMGVAHHVMHKGYDKVPGVPHHKTSKGFAKGKRRFVDWFDWIIPEAWHREHNVLHHYRLGETMDPDLVELNSRWFREDLEGVPRVAKYAMIFGIASTWKFSYYSPNTLRVLQDSREGHQDHLLDESRGKKEYRTGVVDPRDPRGRELWKRSWLPYPLWHFGAIPALYLPLGPVASFNVLMNSLLAEWLTNLHTFSVIVSNHAGSDVYRFDDKVHGRDEFLLRQILGSVNFDCGNDVIDFLHGWLNYQVEHHLWPDLSMRQYQVVQPKVEALCKEYGVPYVKDSMFVRLKELVGVIMGDGPMLRTDSVRTKNPDVSGKAEERSTEQERGEVSEEVSPEDEAAA